MSNYITINKYLAGIILSSILFYSCGSRTYFPQRIQYYSFDTCRQLKLVFEPYILGLGTGVALTPINHLALALDEHTHTTIGFNPGTFLSQSSSSSASGTDYSIGYFKKYKSGAGFDVFAVFGREYLTGDTINYSEFLNRYDTISFARNYYMFSIQPSFYYNDPNRKSVNIAIGCRLTTVYDYRTSLNSTERKGLHFDDFLIEPGFEFAPAAAPAIKFGLGLHLSTTGHFNDGMWPITISLKIVPEFGNKTRLNPFAKRKNSNKED